jgi:hypothetical protein
VVCPGTVVVVELGDDELDEWNARPRPAKRPAGPALAPATTAAAREPTTKCADQRRQRIERAGSDGRGPSNAGQPRGAQGSPVVPDRCR